MRDDERTETIKARRAEAAKPDFRSHVIEYLRTYHGDDDKSRRGNPRSEMERSPKVAASGANLFAKFGGARKATPAAQEEQAADDGRHHSHRQNRHQSRGHFQSGFKG